MYYVFRDHGLTVVVGISMLWAMPAAAQTVAAPTSTGISATGATLGGNVTSDGGTALTEIGLVYSESSVNADPLIGGTGVS